MVRVRDAFVFVAVEYGATMVELSRYFGDPDHTACSRAYHRTIATAARHRFYGRLLIKASREYRSRQVIRWRVDPTASVVRSLVLEDGYAM